MLDRICSYEEGEMPNEVVSLRFENGKLEEESVCRVTVAHEEICNAVVIGTEINSISTLSI